MDIFEILRMIAALGVTLGLIGVGAWALRRWGPSTLVRLQTAPADRRLTVIETLMLDPGRRLVLVRFDHEERLILLGEGSVLAQIPAPSRPRAKARPPAETAS